jgi:hypothetical protein
MDFEIPIDEATVMLEELLRLPAPSTSMLEELVGSSAPPDQLFCLCQVPETSNSLYIECSKNTGGCNGWVHPACCGLEDTSAKLLDDFICPLCAAPNGTQFLCKPSKKRPKSQHVLEPVFIESCDESQTYSLEDRLSLVFTAKGALLLRAEHFWEALNRLGLCTRGEKQLHGEKLGKDSPEFVLVCQVEAAAAALFLYMHKSGRSSSGEAKCFIGVASMSSVLHLAQACCHSWRLANTEPNPFALANIQPRERRSSTREGAQSSHRPEQSHAQSESSRAGGHDGDGSNVGGCGAGRTRRHTRPSSKWKWPDNSLDGRRLKLHPLYAAQVQESSRVCYHHRNRLSSHCRCPPPQVNSSNSYPGNAPSAHSDYATGAAMEEYDHEHCAICNVGGDLVMCEACPCGFHASCLFKHKQVQLHIVCMVCLARFELTINIISTATAHVPLALCAEVEAGAPCTPTG